MLRDLSDLRQVPIVPGTKAPPAGFSWTTDATNDPTIIATWDQKYPGSGRGYVTGMNRPGS